MAYLDDQLGSSWKEVVEDISITKVGKDMRDKLASLFESIGDAVDKLKDTDSATIQYTVTVIKTIDGKKRVIVK